MAKLPGARGAGEKEGSTVWKHSNSHGYCALTLCFTLVRVTDMHASYLFLQHSWEVSGIPILPMATLKFGKE